MTSQNKIGLLPQTFSWKEANLAGITQSELINLVRQGILEHEDHGVYRKIAVDDEDSGNWSSYEIATKKIARYCVVGLISALEYHHLTEALPRDVWLLVDQATRSSKRGVRLFRRQNPNWEIGIIDHGTFKVTNIERSIVETLAFKNRLGPNDAYYALNKAINSKKTNPQNILKMAEALGLLKRIRPHLEHLIYG